MNLIVGDLVSKKRGYAFTGEVRAVFTNMKGQQRVVVELLNSGGLLHIFSPSDVEPIGEAASRIAANSAAANSAGT